MVFLKSVLARRRFPEIGFKYKNVKFDFEEYMNRWNSRHLKERKTRKR